MFLWSRWHVLGDSGRHSGIVRDDGEAVGFGCNEGGQCHVLPGPAGTHHVATAASACHSILVRDAGESVEFGYNRYGQGDELARAVRGALARRSRLGTHPLAPRQISLRPTSPRFVRPLLGTPLLECFAGYITVA